MHTFPSNVAIVQDWRDTWRGGERVLAELLTLNQHAELLTLVDFLQHEEPGPVRSARTQATHPLRATPSARQDVPRRHAG